MFAGGQFPALRENARALRRSPSDSATEMRDAGPAAPRNPRLPPPIPTPICDSPFSTSSDVEAGPGTGPAPEAHVSGVRVADIALLTRLIEPEAEAEGL